MLYEVETKALNRAVKRNRGRFPDDFMFQLSSEEAAEVLRYQIGTSNAGRGGRRYRPYVFTEQGIAMLSGVLTSERAIQVNIAIMRTFVRLRQLLATHEDLARQLEELRWRQEEQGQQIHEVFETIQHLIEAPAGANAVSGFRAPRPATNRNPPVTETITLRSTLLVNDSGRTGKRVRCAPPAR